MSEVNHNSNSLNSESIWINQSNSSDYESVNSLEQQNQIIEESSEAVSKNNSLSPEHLSTETKINSVTDARKNPHKLENSGSLSEKMNWQKVAHKLREYNRKLLKKVFRLEQELAEIDNNFNKYLEKSNNSDLLLAQQAEEIKSHQEKFALLNQQLVGSQQQIDSQELIIKQIAEQHELSQKQAAQLERECTLLQEKYNRQAFELVTKEQLSQELHTQLDQQQQTSLQLEAKLKQYQETAISRSEKAAKATSRQQNYPHNRYIQPWSTASIPEPKIALPKNKSQPIKATLNNLEPSETIKTAAKIATWSAEPISHKKMDKSQAASKTTKSSESKKPQSLAAIDLPTFPRHQ